MKAASELIQQYKNELPAGFEIQDVKGGIEYLMIQYANQFLCLDEAWPLKDILKKLVEATDYLLHVKNYDKLGHEEVWHCFELAKGIIKKLEQA